MTPKTPRPQIRHSSRICRIFYRKPAFLKGLYQHKAQRLKRRVAMTWRCRCQRSALANQHAL